MSSGRRSFNASGFILAMTIIVIVIVTFVAMLALTLGATQKKLSDQVSGKRMVAYYRSQAGLVDAQWRMRYDVDKTDDIDPQGGGTPKSFKNDGREGRENYDPPPYYIDLDTNSIYRESTLNTKPNNLVDVRVDIGPYDPTAGARPIDSVGYDKTN